MLSLLEGSNPSPSANSMRGTSRCRRAVADTLLELGAATSAKRAASAMAPRIRRRVARRAPGGAGVHRPLHARRQPRHPRRRGPRARGQRARRRGRDRARARLLGRGAHDRSGGAWASPASSSTACVRDVAALEAHGFPVFSTGDRPPRAPRSSLPGPGGWAGRGRRRGRAGGGLARRRRRRRHRGGGGRGRRRARLPAGPGPTPRPRCSRHCAPAARRSSCSDWTSRA